MTVSRGLQKHFDSQSQKKKKHIATKLDDLRGMIDPIFIASFESFHDQVLGILDDTPESVEIVAGEINELETKLERVNKKKKIKTFQIVSDEIA